MRDMKANASAAVTRSPIKPRLSRSSRAHRRLPELLSNYQPYRPPLHVILNRPQARSYLHDLDGTIERGGQHDAADGGLTTFTECRCRSF